jgi:hypothetical protein
MAQIPLVSGGSQPVFATDTLNGPQLAANATYTPAGVPVNFMGPKLDFFGVGLGNSAFNQAGVNGAVQQILQQIQQTATVAMYQVDNTNNTVDFSVAIFPTGAYTAATLQAAIQGLGNIYNSSANTYCNVAAATVTSVGFRLASSATSAS